MVKADTMARLILALLGPLYVTLDGQPVTSFGYNKVRALLAYLAVERHRAHDRAALGTLLWPDEPQAVARKNLRTALATLRQALGDTTAAPPILLVTRDTVQFNPASDYELDVTTFGALLSEVERHAHPAGVPCAACAARLAQAVELYRGAYLQEVSVPGSVAWEEWALLIRERLHTQMLDALGQLMAYHEARGEADRARQYAWRALVLESWDEGAHRCLMRVYVRSGRRSAAMAQYKRCRQILADELGVAPSVETVALYERIRTGALAQEHGAAAPSR
jgi:DNA-binding SARP family transcriptional activator